ncbi:MAG TPA: PepSY domain-containing protein [Bacteroidetes bacterium]|nr:PepSY domain-containing protein [Bacteroidota bacterium]
MSTQSTEREHIARKSRSIRLVRKIHRVSAIALFFFMFVIAVTGIILGWKKHSGDLIQPRSYTGTTSDLSRCLPVDSLAKRAFHFLRDSVSPHLPAELDRIDLRPDKGMVKFIFSRHYHEVQLDMATGELLNLGFRTSDLVENIHDASLLDRLLNTPNGQIKLVYNTLMGLALITFVLTGLWLWYGPRGIKKTGGRTKRPRRAAPRTGG